MKKVSVIIPVYNEQENISALARQIKLIRRSGHEVVVVDGGSNDLTAAIFLSCGIAVEQCPQKGRAAQMNYGASKASGELFWFVHADTVISLKCVLALSELVDTNLLWGRFQLKLSGQSLWFRIIESFMEWRSSLTSIITGDQALFVSKIMFEKIGGYRDQPLMEDIEISKQLKRISKPKIMPLEIISSSRRWQQKGVLRTIGLMWCLRLAYFLKVNPKSLAKWY